MVIVYHRDGGLTAADRATAAEQVGGIASAHPLTDAPKGVPSEDGSTLMYPVASTEPGTDEKARDQLVNEVREIAKGGDGLSVDVGGEGALATDASEVYNSLDGPLLYTTAAVVALLIAEELTRAITPTVNRTTDSMTSMRVNPRRVRTLI